MALISITTDDPDALDRAPVFPVLPSGKHLFVVANRLEVTQSEKGNDVIRLEARCQDEDDNKGMVVFHNFVFIKDPVTDGQKKSLEINNGQFAQFTAGCGVATMAHIKAGGKYDLDDFEGKFFNANSAVKLEDTNELDEAGNKIKQRRASVKQFLFCVEEEETEEGSAS